MRRTAVILLVAVLTLVGASVLTAGPHGSRASAASPLGLACSPYGDQTICSGEVPSFDTSSWTSTSPSRPTAPPARIR